MGNRTSRQRQDNDTNQQQNGNGLPQNSHYARYPPSNTAGRVPPPPASYGHSGQYYNMPYGGGGRHPVNTSAGQGRRQGTSQSQEAQPPPQSLTQTATIRNAVNLKKSSLTVVPSEADPNFLTIGFEFDASEPCCVMTFCGVKEDVANGSKLVHLPQVYKDANRVFASCVEYEKGMQQKFPKDDMSLFLATQHGIDLSQVCLDELLSLGQQCSEEGFPVVVRLATVTEKGRKEGFTLNDIVPGEPLQPWIQGQTTFAMIDKQDSGEWTVSVVKQKLWVDGVSYVLQEIYGLENAVSPVENSSTEEHLCVICLSNRRDTTALPCRHMCMCHECADALRRQSSVCPICRNKVDSLLRIKLNHRNE
mmetsp:Transcript_12404/g.24946  ORF Transcript_12404/g.24946 Transcript_12404/m.24946 type:complete len:363 (-) Transcript_12404:33-1121(-)